VDDITPRTNTALFGHDEAQALLMQDFASGKLAHGWIISGPRGIGKATLAYKFARALLGGGEGAHRRMIAGSHADLLVVEQAYDEKKEEFKNDISVEQAREIAKFLSLTPGEGQWRVVIIDSVDALNANGANAILKILEEPPPQAIFLLVSHNPGRLLPTIRSRCRNLRLHAPDRATFIKIMRHVMPGIDANEMKALAQLSGMSPGVALELQGQGATTLYEQLLGLLENAPALDTAAIHAFADQMAGGKTHANWLLWTRLVLALLERVARQASEIEDDPISEEETAVIRRLAALHPAHIWAAKWQQVADQFSLAERLHLDYKQVIITFFHSIESKEPVILSVA